MIDQLLPEQQQQHFHTEGYLIVRGLLDEQEVQMIQNEIMTLLEHKASCFETPPLSAEEAGGEPLKMFPRMLYPHRVSPVLKTHMLNPKLIAQLEALFGEPPLAAQSMVYFKPPGARGQALHQDNYYLRVEPGTCIAAWIAIDPSDQENGGLVVVPETQQLDIQCPHLADPVYSYFRDEVVVPEGKRIIPATMKPGDVLFFNGSTIHGSFPNTSLDRFRRSFICHYVGESTARIGRHISDDLHRGNGEIVVRERNGNAGPCGIAIAEEAH